MEDGCDFPWNTAHHEWEGPSNCMLGDGCEGLSSYVH